MIGWREWVALPNLQIAAIKAKVDTGARSSSLHATGIVIDATRVSFEVRPDHDDPGQVVRCRTELLELREVKSSNGQVEERPVVRALLLIGSDKRVVDLTLTSREGMGFEMLLGREAIRGSFAVDPGRSFLLGGSRHVAPPWCQSAVQEKEKQ